MENDQPKRERVRKPIQTVKNTIRIQQGFTFFDLTFNSADAKIYTDLLDRNKIKWRQI